MDGLEVGFDSLQAQSKETTFEGTTAGFDLGEWVLRCLRLSIIPNT
jgi:hypothetical protein